MKEDKRRSSNHQIIKFITKVFTNPTVYVILLILSYSLGYLSRSWSLPTTQQSQQYLLTQLDNFRVTTQCGKTIPAQLVSQTILDRIFDGISPYVNFPPPAVTSLLKPTRIHGWGSYGTVFRSLIQRVKPRVIVEVGTFLGASTLHMVNLTRTLGLQTQIICVDDFRGWAGFRDDFKDIEMINGDVLLLYQFMQNVVSSNATESVLPLPFSAGSGLEKLCELGVAADLIEIDAGHDFLSAWGDINRAYRILRPGGVLFGHDYFNTVDNRGVKRAVVLFAQMNNFSFSRDGEHWVINTA